MTDQWRAVTRFERADFYSDWLRHSQENEQIVHRDPVIARGKDVIYFETPQDYRFGMLIGEQVGFPTNGTNLCRAFLPAGHHTGKHRHGEEAIHILSGEGFIVVDDRRYDFHTGTTIHVPYMSTHQLFTTGKGEVSYVSAMSMDLDLFVRLGRLEQLEEKGPNQPGFEAAFPADDGHFDTKGRRITLHIEDAPDEQKRRDEIAAQRRAEAEARGETVEAHGHGHGHGHGGGHGDGHGDGHGGGHGGHAAADDGAFLAPGARRRRSAASQNPHRHGQILILMGGGESPSPERNGFTAVSVAMTNIFEEVPHTSSHLHSHTEAVLFVLEGVGFSEVDYEHYDWQAGDAVHVTPKMTRHEHFNPSDRRTRTLRIEYGIRYFYEPLWEGFEKVEHRETAIARP
jgi:mannose-6-phosphate isomerase-like protein (cupin superfamily)